MRVPADYQEQAPGRGACAQLDLRSRQLAPVGAHAHYHRSGQALRAHDELQRLARIAMELERAPVRGDVLPAAQYVAACHLHLELSGQVAAAIGHGDAEWSPSPGLESVGKSHHRGDVYGAGGDRLRRRIQQGKQHDEIRQARTARQRAAHPGFAVTALPGNRVRNHALL